MQFNAITGNRLGLVEDTLYLCGLPTTTASYSSYPLVDITRNINNAYIETVPLIWKSAYKWRYSDSANLSASYGTINVSATQQEYAVPTNAQVIHRAEYLNGSDYVALTQIDEKDVTNGTGTPTGWCPVGFNILLDPTPTTSLSAGLRLVIDKSPTLFTTASTTAEPGFSTPFHKLLSYGAAIDFVQDKATQDRLVAMKARLEQQMISFYSKRNVEGHARMSVSRNINRYK